MTLRRQLLISLLVAVVCWADFSWPLPRHLGTHIPSATLHQESGAMGPMSSGDHLQFLYYLRLFDDMLGGGTPFFYNLYEFNTGDDEARFDPNSYYFPFAGLFSLFSRLGGCVVAWNLTGLAALWLAYWATWRLARRYTDREWIAATASLATFVLPFRWVNLFGGSPMGLAMLWTPLVMLGVERAVRGDDWRGGLLAGLSLLFSLWTDLHAFFFNTMIVPVWCVVAFIARGRFAWRRAPDYMRLAGALLPIPAFAALAVGIRKLHTSAALVRTEPRSWNEAALFSPHAGGLLGSDFSGTSGHIYIGLALLTLLLAGLAAAGFAGWRRRAALGRSALVYAAVLAAIAGAALLALGCHGPAGGKLFDLARHFVPYYDMIRQPAKIYTLMPPMLAVAAALAYTLAAPVVPARALRIAWIAAWIWILASARGNVAVGLESVRLGQQAYATVAKHAQAQGLRPGILVVPLWPGDSHQASVYQHFALQYRLRMVNGYTAMEVPGYRDDIFHRFETINQGALDDAQLDELLRRGIPYVLVHEDMFPEKVSPYPIGFTLRNLLSHPRLEFLAQDERVWAFRILAQPADRSPVWPDWDHFFTARRGEAERAWKTPAEIRESPDAGNGAFLRLTPSSGGVSYRAGMVVGMPSLVWQIRCRGHGTLVATSRFARAAAHALPVAADAWIWQKIPTDHEQGGAHGQLDLRVGDGSLDIDVILLAQDRWKPLAAGESRSYTAARFFHAGYTDPARECIHFKVDTDPAAPALYGPKLPFEPGAYEAELVFETPAPAGTVVGMVNLEQDERTGSGDGIEVTAGSPARVRFARSTNLPVNFVFVYLARADVTLQRITFRRLE